MIAKLEIFFVHNIRADMTFVNEDDVNRIMEMFKRGMASGLPFVLIMDLPQAQPGQIRQIMHYINPVNVVHYDLATFVPMAQAQQWRFGG